MQIFRVIVRGRFGELGPAYRAALLDAVHEHDVVSSALGFTPSGTFAYDERIDFFTYRVEVRLTDEEVSDVESTRDLAFARAVEVAAADLENRGLPWRSLTPTGSNMSDVWN